MRIEYLFLVIYMGELDSKYFKEDGSQREADEDSNPVGDFHNPNHPGGEDMPHELSGKPLYVASKPVVPKPAAPVSSMGSQYTDGPGGTYTHSSAEHTGEATAEANGVDISDAEDDSMDGM